MRAGMDKRPKIGPTTKPTNRSTAVQSPPPTTWKKSIAHNLFEAIAATSATKTTPTMGSAFLGTMSKFREGGAARSCAMTNPLR